MMNEDISSQPDNRPYRSHKVPACDFCRKRKTRCTQDLPGRPCLLCRLNALECSRTGTREESASARSSPRPQKPKVSSSVPKRRRTDDRAVGAHVPLSQEVQPLLPPSLGDLKPDPSDEKDQFIEGTSASIQRNSQVIIGPAVARDVQVLQQYMSPTYNLAESHARPNPYSIYSDDPISPVVYVTVPRHRAVTLSGNGSPGFKEFVALENLLRPDGEAAFNLYFETIQPAFPLLDEKTVREAYRNNALPYALVCEIYSGSLNWRASSVLAHRPRPDLKYVWGLGQKALTLDFKTPSFATILSSIVDLIGRPISSVTYNAVNLGRTVTLAHSLGLNRNPASWNLDHRQKSLRIRAWWSLLINDRWASLCHGTPPLINAAQYDVPLPNLESLLISVHAAGPRIIGGQTFIALCQLTELLGDVLPLIYDLKGQGDTLKRLRKIESALDDWQDSLPSWERSSPGALSLDLSVLAIKMCFCRIALQNTLHDLDAKQYHQARCRKAAHAVINFVNTLQQPADLDVFWLPYTAYHFSSAATLTMRSALETEDPTIASECIANAQTLMATLRRARDDYGWDLGDICLIQCEGILQKMSDGNLRKSRRDTDVPRNDMNIAEGEVGIDYGFDVFGQDPSMEPIPDLWDLLYHDGQMTF